MPFTLLPTIITDSITDISPELLKGRGIRLLMLDFDNTIVPYTCDTPTRQRLEWLEGMKDSGISICVVSNSRRQRVQEFCQKYGIPCITHAAKPGSRGMRACLKRFGIPAEQAALVGDQIYTDTLGANLTGITSILVTSIDNHNFWLKARHVLELPFIFAARKRRI